MSHEKAPAAGCGNPLLWAVHDGRIGIKNQVLGLTEALGLPFVEKCFRPRLPWSHVPPLLWPAFGRVGAPGSDALAPPWPDILVTAGRIGAAAGIAVKRANDGRTFLAQIQDPRLGRRFFDLLVVPEHDRARGPNVIVTRGAVHRVTPARLAEAGRRFAPAFAHLPRPRIAVLIGGRNRVYRFDLEKLAEIADQLAALARREGGSLLVTPSRRTGAAGERLLRDKLAGLPAYIWDGTGENPYFALLELGDAIIVTEDSISMVTEAASTGKPVHVVALAGGSRKFRDFYRLMQAHGVTRPFTGALESWRYEPPNDTAKAAAELLRRLGAREPARLAG
ncbi:MAG TPA: mitochondrial fission ELM1 family protein [Stellaceae bacterium]|nr:mitochondrial fission ELM1 family protein [Stellaceae bacterium]